MDKNKLYELAILVLLVGLIIIIGWRKYLQLNPGFFSYTNTNYGYSLQLPATWQGYYDVIEQGSGSTTIFMYKALKAEPAQIFSISQVPSSSWQLISQDKFTQPTSRWLAERNGLVFYAQWLANNPYQGQDARNYLAMVRDVSEVLNSYSIIQTNAVPIQDQSVCIQVITTAKNSLTKEVKDFATPCNVPAGWDIVRP